MGTFQTESPVTSTAEQPALVPQPNKAHGSATRKNDNGDQDLIEGVRRLKQENAALKQENASLKDDNIKMTSENVKLGVQNAQLKADLRIERQKRHDAEERATHFKEKCDSQKEGNVPKRTEEIIVRRRLKHKLSEGQINGYLFDAKRSRKWTDQDFALAEEIRGRVANQKINFTCSFIFCK